MIDLTIEPAKNAQQENALRILFQHLPETPQRQAIGKVRALLGKELDTEGLLIAEQSGQLKGVILAVPAPGAAGLIWPPQTLDPGLETVENALVHWALSFLKKRSAKIVQALLEPHEKSLGGALERNGFAHITSLEFLRHSLQLSAQDLDAPETLAFETYGPSTKAQLGTTLLSTYEGTLDCPELNGVRTMEEIIAGHQAQGIHDPRKWWLARREGKPVGVLLMSEVPDWDGWEIVYLGIVAAARRQGYGRQLVLKALREGRAAGARQITVSVDRRNFLARRLYGQLGFESWDRREVYLAIL